MDNTALIRRHMVLLTCEAYLDYVFGPNDNYEVTSGVVCRYVTLADEEIDLITHRRPDCDQPRKRDSILVRSMIDEGQGYFSFEAIYSDEENTSIQISFKGTGCVDRLEFENDTGDIRTAYNLDGQVTFDEVVYEKNDDVTLLLPTGSNGRTMKIFDELWMGIGTYFACPGAIGVAHDYGEAFGHFEAYPIGLEFFEA